MDSLQLKSYGILSLSLLVRPGNYRSLIFEIDSFFRHYREKQQGIQEKYHRKRKKKPKVKTPEFLYQPKYTAALGNQDIRVDILINSLDLVFSLPTFFGSTHQRFTFGVLPEVSNWQESNEILAKEKKYFTPTGKISDKSYLINFPIHSQIVLKLDTFIRMQHGTEGTCRVLKYLLMRLSTEHEILGQFKVIPILSMDWHEVTLNVYAQTMRVYKFIIKIISKTNLLDVLLDNTRKKLLEETIASHAAYCIESFFFDVNPFTKEPLEADFEKTKNIRTALAESLRVLNMPDRITRQELVDGAGQVRDQTDRFMRNPESKEAYNLFIDPEVNKKLKPLVLQLLPNKSAFYMAYIHNVAIETESTPQEITEDTIKAVAKKLHPVLFMNTFIGIPASIFLCLLYEPEVFSDISEIEKKANQSIAGREQLTSFNDEFRVFTQRIQDNQEALKEQLKQKGESDGFISSFLRGFYHDNISLRALRRASSEEQDAIRLDSHSFLKWTHLWAQEGLFGWLALIQDRYEIYYHLSGTMFLFGIDFPDDNKKLLVDSTIMLGKDSFSHDKRGFLFQAYFDCSQINLPKRRGLTFSSYTSIGISFSEVYGDQSSHAASESTKEEEQSFRIHPFPLSAFAVDSVYQRVIKICKAFHLSKHLTEDLLNIFDMYNQFIQDNAQFESMLELYPFIVKMDLLLEALHKIDCKGYVYDQSGKKISTVEKVTQDLIEFAKSFRTSFYSKHSVMRIDPEPYQSPMDFAGPVPYFSNIAAGVQRSILSLYFRKTPYRLMLSAGLLSFGSSHTKTVKNIFGNTTELSRSFLYSPERLNVLLGEASHFFSQSDLYLEFIDFLSNEQDTPCEDSNLLEIAHHFFRPKDDSQSSDEVPSDENLSDETRDLFRHLLSDLFYFLLGCGSFQDANTLSDRKEDLSLTTKMRQFKSFTHNFWYMIFTSKVCLTKKISDPHQRQLLVDSLSRLLLLRMVITEEEFTKDSFETIWDDALSTSDDSIFMDDFAFPVEEGTENRAHFYEYFKSTLNADLLRVFQKIARFLSDRFSSLYRKELTESTRTSERQIEFSQLEKGRIPFCKIQASKKSYFSFFCILELLQGLVRPIAQAENKEGPLFLETAHLDEKSPELIIDQVDLRWSHNFPDNPHHFHFHPSLGLFVIDHAQRERFFLLRASTLLLLADINHQSKTEIFEYAFDEHVYST